MNEPFLVLLLQSIKIWDSFYIQTYDYMATDREPSRIAMYRTPSYTKPCQLTKYASMFVFNFVTTKEQYTKFEATQNIFFYHRNMNTRRQRSMNTMTLIMNTLDRNTLNRKCCSSIRRLFIQIYSKMFLHGQNKVRVQTDNWLKNRLELFWVLVKLLEYFL